MLILAITLAFSAFIQSSQQAQAFNPAVAVPTAIQIGTGTYVVGALALAGVVGLIGYEEHSEAIHAHAQNTWATGTQAAKDSLDLSIKAAQGTGNAIVNLQTDFINFIDTKLANITANTSTLMTQATTTETYEIWGTSRFTDLAIADSTGKAWAGGNGLYKTIQIFADAYMVQVSMIYGLNSVSNYTITYSKSTDSAKYDELYTIAMQAVNTKTSANVIAAANAFGLSYGTVVVEEWMNNKGIIETQMQEAWQAMRDAGLVLPIDGVTTYVGDKVVQYDPTADTYKDDAGTTYAPNDVNHAFPRSRIRTKNVDIPGVYVDTPALTGNPTLDDTLVKNPDIPKTTTNILTGSTFMNPDIPTAPPPEPPPPDTTPKPLPRVPNSGTVVPVAIFLGFFDLLRALLMYFVRMFNWIMTLPFISEKPIDNEIYQWFRSAKILGVYPYSLITSMATFFLGFKLVKAARRFLP